MHSQRTSQEATSALIPALVLFGGLTLLLIGLLASRPTVIPAQTSEATGEIVAASPEAAEAIVEATTVPQEVALALDPAKVKAGENSFQTICAACHGFNAMGIPGLGKPLIGSTFVNGLSDAELLAFLQVGRDISDPLNTTGVMMPARGGNPNLTDDKLVEVIAYIRSLNQEDTQAGAGANAVTPTELPIASGPQATSAPFTPPDISGLAVPTSISGGDTGTTTTEVTAEPTSAPTNELAATNVPFTPPDISGLAVPTSVSGNH